MSVSKTAKIQCGLFVSVKFELGCKSILTEWLSRRGGAQYSLPFTSSRYRRTFTHWCTCTSLQRYPSYSVIDSISIRSSFPMPAVLILRSSVISHFYYKHMSQGKKWVVSVTILQMRTLRKTICGIAGLELIRYCTKRMAFMSEFISYHYRIRSCKEVHFQLISSAPYFHVQFAFKGLVVLVGLGTCTLVCSHRLAYRKTA